MITPTPRAMSPQDIVRIYVPPAPPDEQPQQHQQHQQHHQQRSQSAVANESGGTCLTKESQPNSLPLFSDTSSSIVNSQETPKQLLSLEFPNTESNNKNSIIYGSGELTPVHYSLHRSDEELVKSFSESISGHSLSHISNAGGGIGTTIAGQRSTSSSRRGSLSRKSPLAMFESNTLMECSHILAKRKLSTQSNGPNVDNRIKLSIGNSSSENLSNLGHSTPLSLLRRNSLSNGESAKIMTSFEQLANTDSVDRGEAPIRITSRKRHESGSPDDDEGTYSYSYYNSYKSAESRQRKSPVVISNNTKKYVSESNIQYKTFSTAKSNAEETDIEYTALNRRRPHSSDIETSPFRFADQGNQPASHTTTSFKEYKRFYSTSVDDDEPEHGHSEHHATDDVEDDEPIKSSDDSSASPVSKSVQITPINETIPLLQPSPISMQHKSQMNSTIYHASQSPKAVSNASPTSASSQFKMKSPSHIPVAKTKSPTTPPDVTTPPMARPSRIPLVYNNQRILSGAHITSPVIHSSSSASPVNSPNELNRVLPPVETVTSPSSRSANEIRSQLTSSATTPNGSSFEFNGKRTRRIGTPSTTSSSTTSTASNAIRIHVNTNDQN